MSVKISSFWGDFNAALWGVFENPDFACCLASKTDCKPLLDQRFEFAKKRPKFSYPAYATGTTVNKLRIVCRNLVVADFVKRELKLQLINFFPRGCEHISTFAEEIVLSEPEDGKIIINIPFETLMLFVQASLTQTVFLEFSLKIQKDSHPGQCDLLNGKMSYHNGTLIVDSSLKRLQVGQSSSCREMEVDLTDSLVYLFGSGERCRKFKSPDVAIASIPIDLVNYLKISRSTPAEICRMVSKLLRNHRDLVQEAAEDVSDLETEVDDEIEFTQTSVPRPDIKRIRLDES